MQEKVDQNGGEYTGDLTKDVTHLIAKVAQGKKYDYASQWQKKVVGIKWLKNSLERGMQLDESLYHPTKPEHEQGIGAWNSQAGRAQLGKRDRVDPAEVEPPRKLRRIASARLGSQNESIWGDIAAGSSESSNKSIPPPLRSSKSMPVIQAHTGRLTNAAEVQTARAVSGVQHLNAASTNFFGGRVFYIREFDKRKTEALENIINKNGGRISEIDKLLKNGGTSEDGILVVPHNLSRARISLSLRLDLFPIVVTELWIETCLSHKMFVPPKSYALGGILDSYPAPEIPFPTINCTGFEGLEGLHISKMVNLLGAKYEQIFRQNTSLLICKNADPTIQKIHHAQEWSVPVVSYKWLWKCLQISKFIPIDDFLVTPRRPQGQRIQGQPGADFAETTTNQYPAKAVREQKKVDALQHERAERSSNEDAGKQHKEPKTIALNEISDNTPSRSCTSSPVKTMPLFKTLDGPGSSPKQKASQFSTSRSKVAPGRAETEASEPVNAQALNGAIQDLLNLKAKARAAGQITNGQQKPEKRKLLGRALSNLSNSSVNSTKLRASRASSVDSLNTDGLGSELTPLGDEGAEFKAPLEGSTHSREKASFTDGARRNSSHATDSMKTIGHSNDANDLDPYYGHSFPIDEQNLDPPRTQLGYQGSEEAVKLREKLEQRQAKNSTDNSNTKGLRSKLASVGRIKDDEMLLAGRAGAISRRTRGREKEVSPQGLKDF